MKSRIHAFNTQAYSLKIENAYLTTNVNNHLYSNLIFLRILWWSHSTYLYIVNVCVLWQFEISGYSVYVLILHEAIHHFVLCLVKHISTLGIHWLTWLYITRLLTPLICHWFEHAFIDITRRVITLCTVYTWRSPTLTSSCWPGGQTCGPASGTSPTLPTPSSWRGRLVTLYNKQESTTGILSSKEISLNQNSAAMQICWFPLYGGSSDPVQQTGQLHVPCTFNTN